MAVKRQQKGAHRKGAPFAFLCGLFFAAFTLPHIASGCPLDKVDETAAVSYVYDGDTFKLEDGRKVRFIGINTPEINRDGGPSEPYARVARRRLQALLADGKVSLRLGSEMHDRYGRLLAHPYLPDGRSISALLLDEGLAAAVAIPPNLWQNDCYLQREAQAREKSLGIWSASGGGVVMQSTGLVSGNEGFALLQGGVEELDESRKSLWLELEGNVALRIPRRDLHYFDDGWLAQLAGRRVEARGWLTYYKGKWRMSVRHPNALRLLERE